MRRLKTLAPGVDPVEPRVLLSSVPMAPVPPGLPGVVRDVRLILAEMARTGQVHRASVELTNVSARLTNGLEVLSPQWQVDLAQYRPHVKGSIAAVRGHILNELYGFARFGLPPGGGLPSPLPCPPPTGPTGPPTGPTAPLVSRDSATVVNDTGYALSIKVQLNAPNGPFLTQILPSNYGSSALFDFHSATGGFLTISIIRADGLQPPYQFTTGLNMPLNGYYGTAFTVSLMGTQYFNVTPP